MTETRAAQWRPCASRLALEARAQMLADIRSFFTSRKVMEVETAILSCAGNTDPNIAGMRTDSSPAKFLRSSPEFPMKRLLAAGLSDIYEMGRVFRSDEYGRNHNPEFTMLEWYRRECHYLDLAGEAVELIRHCGRGRFDLWNVCQISYRELFLSHTGLDPYHADESDWAIQALERNLNAGPLDAAQWQDLILTHVIQPALDPESITIVKDFPVEQAALARVRQDDPPVAERFEVFLGPLELANGYQELLDAKELLQRFERENHARKSRGDDAAVIDHRLLEAMQHGFPVCSGVALGVDRLLMCLLELDSIQAVLAFPSDRA